MAAARALRIGCVKYLNARPLIAGWEGKVHFDHPSNLCQLLAAGTLDVALVSSFEYLRNPIYTIVDDVSISSDGPVYSVIVAHRGELEEIDEVELDPASETSVNLVRCLVAEKHLPMKLRANVPDKLPVTRKRARLLIGDRAIRFREQNADCRFWDLGEEWHNQTGLPFVYALWLVRPEVGNAEEIADKLRALRDTNLATLDSLIETLDFDPEFCGRYYRRNLRFGFDGEQQNGLKHFHRLCQQHDLLPKQAIQFNVV